MVLKNLSVENSVASVLCTNDNKVCSCTNIGESVS